MSGFGSRRRLQRTNESSLIKTYTNLIPEREKIFFPLNQILKRTGWIILARGFAFKLNKNLQLAHIKSGASSGTQLKKSQTCPVFDSIFKTFDLFLFLLIYIISEIF
jgi:hypothetical protein